MTNEELKDAFASANIITVSERLKNIEDSQAVILEKLDLLLAKPVRKSKKIGAENLVQAITGQPVELLPYERIDEHGVQVGTLDTETGEILEWPEWFSLGWGLKGWTVTLKIAEHWRNEGGYSEEYCLAQVYKVRGWWSKKHEKEGRNPYFTFQAACRENWANFVEPVSSSADKLKHERDYDQRWGGGGK